MMRWRGSMALENSEKAAEYSILTVIGPTLLCTVHENPCAISEIRGCQPVSNPKIVSPHHVPDIAIAAPETWEGITLSSSLRKAH